MSAKVSSFSKGGATTTVVGEITRELVNSTDGQGLHFDGAAGNIDIATPPDLGTKFSMEFIVQADAWGAAERDLIDFANGGRFLLYADSSTSYNLAIYSVAATASFGVKVLDDLKVHHLVVTVDGTAAVLYDNGNEVGTATITSPNIDSCADARIGSPWNATGTGFFEGTFYRARFWNKTLTSAEVTDAYENATVSFGDQYGSQTELVNGAFANSTNSNRQFSSFTGASATGFTGVYDDGKTNNRAGAPLSSAMTLGKNYRATFDYTGSDGTVELIATTDAALSDGQSCGTLTEASATGHTVKFTASASGYDYIAFLDSSPPSSGSLVVSNFTLVEIGCVSDYDLAFANPTQSDQVQDRAGAADGTASATGVVQVTKIEQLNTEKLYTGTEELIGRIKSVTSATTIGAVFIYDTSQDSCEWRSKCKGLSWYDEASSATRSARSEFPAMALIVADNVGNHPLTNTVTIYDLDDPSMPLWLQFTATSQADPYHDFWRRSKSVSAVTALNGRVYFSVGGTTDQAGVKFADFTSDRLGSYGTATSVEWSGYFSGGIADRNSDTKIFLGNTLGAIVHRNVNDVAATVLEGAEIGALGLPIPTVAVATGGGISVILPSGTVNDSSSTAAYTGVEFDHNGGLFATYNHATDSWFSRCEASAYHTNASDFSPLTITETGHGSASSFTPNFLGSAPKIAKLSNDGFAVGTDAALNLYKLNTANGAESAVAYITSAYNTGYMVGDIRGAWLANSLTADRSVKVNTLTQNGTVPYTAGLGVSADLTAIGPFSDSNYLSHASDTDFDFGTGDFSIMFWVKDTVAAAQNYVSRSDASQEAGDWLIQAQSDGSIDFYRHSGSGWVLKKDSAAGSIVAGQWHQVMFVKRSSKIMFYIDGKFDSDTSNAETFTPSGGSALTVGHSLGEGNSATNASLSLLRISATAPTPAQIKAIYEAEKPLFAANAKCLLQSDDGSYSDLIRDLAFDKSSGILSATQYSATAAGVTKFRGLEVVDTFNGKDHGWDDEHTQFATSAGGVTAFSSNSTGCGVLVDLPALDVRAELNEGEDKLPDDGKFHFEGVTTDATATNIGIIPLGINERYTVTAKIVSEEYNADTSNWMSCETIRTYQRDYGSLSPQTVSYKLTDESLASMDAALSSDSNNILVRVTGKAATRMQWKASVEVQRISEKRYER